MKREGLIYAILGPKWPNQGSKMAPQRGKTVVLARKLLSICGPVLSDLIHHSSSLGTKIAALTLENDTHSVLIMVLFWVTQVYKLKSDIINTYEHAHTLKHIYNLRYHCKMSLTSQSGAECPRLRRSVSKSVRQFVSNPSVSNACSQWLI